MAYDDPDHTVRREFGGETTAGANASSVKFRSFQKARLKKVHGVITTAGTSAGAGNAAILMHGTTTVATVGTNGTSTAGSTFASALLDREIASMEELSIKNGTDATGRCHVVYEYEVLQDAVQS